MNKKIKIFTILIAFLIFISLTNTAHSPGFEEWFNASWHYRVYIQVNNTLERTDWPIEQTINFTYILQQLNSSGTFDENSTQLLEYNSTGSILYEVPNQIEKSRAYNESNNAFVTLVFTLNGTTTQDETRYYFLYFDILENGNKQLQNYSSDLNLSYDGGYNNININNSKMEWHIDTSRGENTSGFYRVRDNFGSIIILANSAQTTGEYVQYRNGTENTTFDLRNNVTFSSGPSRISVKQNGTEVFWNDFDNQTNELFIVKEYFFYPNVPWLRIRQNITNIAGYNVTRSSNPAGALTIDLDRFTFPPVTTVNTTEPFSWSWVRANDGSIHVGVLNENESISDFTALNASDVIGINLTETIIPINSSIVETAVVHFNGTQAFDVPQSEGFKSLFANPPIIQLQYEMWEIELDAETNTTIYNRGESIFITGNTTNDPFNLTNNMNATINMGTISGADDTIIILYDDATHGDNTSGDNVFSNVFIINESDSTGEWNVTVIAYDIDNLYLNQSTKIFNITDIYNVNITIIDPSILVTEPNNAIIEVFNYRNDTYIPGANVTCEVNGTPATNITDYDNGTYLLEFTAPDIPGDYILFCNASKNNNTGYADAGFTAENPDTSLDIFTNTSNYTSTQITQYIYDIFEFSSNTTNTGNATARYVNFTLSLPQNWSANTSLSQCGTINISENCSKTFNITIPNKTTPDIYYINVTVEWFNPNTSIYTNQTAITVNVTSNPIVNTLEENISNTVAEGTEKDIGNFTIQSIGNDELINITFNVTGLSSFNITFLPQNITNLSAGLNQSVQVNVSVPEGTTAGVYTGTIFTNTSNDGTDNITINITVPAVTSLSTNTQPPNYTATQITQNNSEIFEFVANASNIGEAKARYVNFTLSVPQNWSANTSLSQCGTINISQTCTKTFNITIPNKTIPGIYYVNVTVEWINPNTSEYTNQTALSVNVTSNPVINIIETNLSDTVGDADEKNIGNFTIQSIGNDALNNITFSNTPLDNFTLEFIPPSVSSVPTDSNQSVQINVTVALTTPPGQYNTTVNASAANDNYDTLVLNITVPINRTWNMNPTSCEKAETPVEGTACNVTVSNNGNILINFNITPDQGNYTTPNETNFTVNADSSHTFSILYNVTNVTPNFFNSTFIIDAIESESNPDNTSLLVKLTPYINPIISVNLSSATILQDGTIEFFINVTDRSTTGISHTTINITRPDNVSDVFNATLVDVIGNLSRWSFIYPNISGNTSMRGLYNVDVYTVDNTGAPETYNTSFNVSAKLNIILITYETSYFQGDSATIFYQLKDFYKIPLENANVTLVIVGPDGNTTYNQTFQTNADGILPPPIIYQIPSDALLGNYTLTAYSSYYDSYINKSVNTTTNTIFEVLAVSGGGLFAEVETTVIWYPDNVMKFAFIVFDAGGTPVDPDSMNLTVYDPADNHYFSIDMSLMIRESEGFYTYDFAMPVSTATGYYLAVLNTTRGDLTTTALKAFRVTTGGPFDLKLNLLEQMVPRGDYLDFEVEIKNMGEVSLDVVLELWTTFNNNTYYYSSETLLSPGITNLTISRNAYIYSDQPLGVNTLQAKLTYDNIKPPVTSSITFTVLEEPGVPEPEEPGPPELPPIPSGPRREPEVEPEPEPPRIFNISIVDYPTEISMVKGWTDFASVMVENLGEGILTNISMLITGIPSPWFTISPEKVGFLAERNTSIFLIEFSIPRSVEAKQYNLMIIAYSDQDREEKISTLTIYESQRDLLEGDLNKLRRDLNEIIEDIDFAEASGKDIKNSRELIQEIRNQIELAEDNLKNDLLDDATDNIVTGFNLIDRIRKILREAEFRIEYRIHTIPLEYIILIIVTLVIVNLIILVWFKGLYKGLGRRIKPQLIKIAQLVESVKGKPEPKSQLIEESERTTRMLKLLEKEYLEGVISKSAYNELKKKAEKNLKHLKKKIE